MSATTATAPSGARVPASILDAEPMLQAAALRARDALIDAANVVMVQAGEIAALRDTVRRQADEIEGLKRHIVSMGRAE